MGRASTAAAAPKKPAPKRARERKKGNGADVAPPASTLTPLWTDGEVDPRELTEDPRNPRDHSLEQVAQLIHNIGEFGFTNPVLATHDGMIIAGHARQRAALEMGLARVPVRRRSSAHPLSEAQRTLLVIADNQLALNATWNEARLAELLGELRIADADLTLIGFTEEQLATFLDGWRADVHLGEKHGEHLESIPGRIVIIVAKEDTDVARKVIEAALADNDIKYEAR